MFRSVITLLIFFFLSSSIVGEGVHENASIKLEECHDLLEYVNRHGYGFTYDKPDIYHTEFKLLNRHLRLGCGLTSYYYERLSFLAKKLSSIKDRSGNWWYWEIGIPKEINLFLVHNGDVVSENLFDLLIEASNYHLPNAYERNSSLSARESSFPNSAANRVDTVLIVVLRSLLSNRHEELEPALTKLWEVLEYVESGDGFYQDGGFIQHTDIPYIGTYGAVLFDGFVEILTLLKHTRWEPEGAIYEQLIKRLAKHVIPFMADGHMLDVVNGRGVSRSRKQSAGHGADIVKLLSNLRLVVPDDLRSQVDELILQAKESANPAHSAYYPSIDRLVYHSEIYSAALAMHSNRIGNYECINGENLKGWFTADGMNYLYLRADDFMDVWPVLDLEVPPGTTTNGKTPPLCGGRKIYAGKKSELNHVGGLVAGEVGLAVMDFYNWDNSVRMKKSWFYLPDKIVAIGSGGKGAVYTNVLQSFVDTKKGSTYSDIQGDNYFHYADSDRNTSLGVYLPYPQKWQRSFEQITGAWSDINEQTPADAAYNHVSKQRLTFNLLHGKDSQHYAYVLLPNQAAKRVQSFAAKPDVRILQQDEKAHVVYDEVTQTFMLNSFTQSEVKLTETLSVEGKVSVVIQRNTSGFEVALSQPVRSGSPVTFTFDSMQADLTAQQIGDRVTVKHNSLVVDTRGLNGAPYKFNVVL